MSTEQKPVQSQGTPAATAQLDATAIQTLLQLLLLERQDAMLEKQLKKERDDNLDKARRRQSDFNVAEQRQREKLCTHRKGGRGLKSPKTDYAVYHHTFIDGAQYIRCMICGAKWKPKDTVKQLYRRGKYIENHTGIGWGEASAMLAESTNTASTSEILVGAGPVQPQEQDFASNPHAVEV